LPDCWTAASMVFPRSIFNSTTAPIQQAAIIMMPSNVVGCTEARSQRDDLERKPEAATTIRLPARPLLAPDH
jgi:hypothetical protein